MSIESLINSSADQIVEGLKTAVLDRAEAKLIDFFGGGFQAELGQRMMPHLAEFASNVQISGTANTPRHIQLLGGDSDAPIFDGDKDV